MAYEHRKRSNCNRSVNKSLGRPLGLVFAAAGRAGGAVEACRPTPPRSFCFVDKRPHVVILRAQKLVERHPSSPLAAPGMAICTSRYPRQKNVRYATRKMHSRNLFSFSTFPRNYFQRASSVQDLVIECHSNVQSRAEAFRITQIFGSSCGGNFSGLDKIPDYFLASHVVG